MLGAGGAVFAAALAVVWAFVVPEQAGTATGAREIAIRWGHPVCWALLAVVGILIAMDAPRRLRDTVAVVAAASYAAFLIALLTA
ncbi:hypothetical protein CW368_02460 [Actinomycetales bacterium SN12]|nr:hypothetical protein CW368_02460 [Actinomycetales bacterium SN12]